MLHAASVFYKDVLEDMRRYLEQAFPRLRKVVQDSLIYGRLLHKCYKNDVAEGERLLMEYNDKWSSDCTAASKANVLRNCKRYVRTYVL